jgi:hypothetical protein
MRKLLAGLLLSLSLCVLNLPAHAVNYVVVATCGSLPSTPAVGSANGPIAIDQNGNVCGGGAITVSGGATSANQSTQITQETAFNTNLGPPGATACATDTGSCSLNALLQRANQRLTTLIAGIPVTNAGTFAVQATLAAETTKVIGTVNQGTSPWVTSTTLAAETTKVIGTVNQGTSPWVVTGAGGTFPVTGTFWQATQPVSGTFWQATQPVSIAAAPLYPLGITPTDLTITSASGASQQLQGATARKGLIVQNIGTSNCGVNPTGGTAAIGGAGTLTLVPQGSYQPRIPTQSAITIICTAGQPIYAEQN